MQDFFNDITRIIRQNPSVKGVQAGMRHLVEHKPHFHMQDIKILRGIVLSLYPACPKDDAFVGSVEGKYTRIADTFQLPTVYRFKREGFYREWIFDEDNLLCMRLIDHKEGANPHPVLLRKQDGSYAFFPIEEDVLELNKLDPNTAHEYLYEKGFEVAKLVRDTPVNPVWAQTLHRNQMDLAYIKHHPLFEKIKSLAQKAKGEPAYARNSPYLLEAVR
jgi:hypothetical protein